LFAVSTGSGVSGVVSGLAQTAQAQAPHAPSYKVGTVAVKFVGTANVSEEVVRANMQVREGGEFDEVMIDRDIRSLYRTGLFEFIEVKREAVSATTFNLVFEVTPKFRVLAVRYEGNKKVKGTRLEKEVKVKPNTSLDERQVKEDAGKAPRVLPEGRLQPGLGQLRDRARSRAVSAPSSSRSRRAPRSRSRRSVCRATRA
jgi:outer membrane protein assembly factor BamA